MHTGLEFMPQDVVEIRFRDKEGGSYFIRLKNTTPKGAYEYAARKGFVPTPLWKRLLKHPDMVEVWTKTENNYGKWEFLSDTSYEMVGG